MAWPTPQDYNEAVQNPRTCFSDPELRQGSPALTPLGLPKVISGAFASVYRLDCPGRRWAVRCFQREYADQRQRYSAISSRLQAAKLPYTVGFDFLREGIRVAGRWYPILKMEWIDGEPLNDYLARNLKQPEVLRSLSRRWIDLTISLRKADIAHGDLQHGNVLVSGGDLKLIDYDAMYVPALAGLQSHEEGHRNYQHPARTGGDYHAGIDNFSAWVIFTSISALAIEPRLWKLPNAGDECLLFRREDFEKPWESKALRALESNGDDHLRTLVSHFRSILSLPLAQVPSLDASIVAPRSKPTPSPSETNRTQIQGLPTWIKDHLPQVREKSELEPIVVEGTEVRVGGAEWIYDHLVGDGPPIVRRPIAIRKIDQISAWSCLGFLGVVLLVGAVGWISSLTFAFTAVASFGACATILVTGYKITITNDAAERKSVKALLDAARTAVDQIENVINLTKLERSRLGEPLTIIKASYEQLPRARDVEIAELNRERAKSLEEIDGRRRRARDEYEAAVKALEDDVGKLQLDLATSLEKIERRRRDASSVEENSALTRLEQRFQATLSQLVKRQKALAWEEKEEVGRLIQASRTLHVNVALSRANLTTSEVSGIGEAYVRRLQAAGVTCASDVAYGRLRMISGIGHAKAHALAAWRSIIEQRAIASAPTSLSPAEASRIRDKYASARDSIDHQIASTKTEEREERQHVIQQYSAVRHDLDDEERAVKRDFDAKRSLLLSRNVEERNRLAAAFSATQQILGAEEELVKLEHAQKQTDVTRRFNRERDRLAAEYKASGIKAAAAQKKINATLAELNQSLFERRFEVHKLVRELEGLKIVGVQEYLGGHLLPKRR